MTEQARNETRVTEPKKTCSECGGSYIGHIGYHAERCPGPGPAVCGCKPGWMHDPDCPEVLGAPDAA